MAEPTLAEDFDPGRVDETLAPPVEPTGATFIGKYQLVREIASGGMGVVYEAIQQQPRRVVALKVIRAGARSTAWVRRFTDESQVLARLRHPNIAQVYDAGSDGFGPSAVPYFAMEFVPGALPIDEYCRRHRLSHRQRIELFLPICDAIEHGHAQGVIHRDLKPPNLLIDSSGRPKVIDFGVAHAADEAPTAAIASTPAVAGVALGPVLVGTLHYMSPEQAGGESSAVTARSDVYSLGVVLYELLCGRLPYALTALNLADAANVITAAAATPPSQIDRALRGDLEAVLLRALEKLPARRYASAAELHDDLSRVLGGETIAAKQNNARYVLLTHAKRAIARHPIAIALAAALFAAALSIQFAEPLIHAATDRPYQRTLTRWLDRPGDQPLSLVRLITLSDTTDLRGLLEREGLGEVDPARPVSMRRLYGRLMEKLAASGAKVVVFDIAFIVPSRFDDDFIRGVEALQAKGIDVVVGTKTWADFREGQTPPVSPAIAAHVKYGCMSASLAGDAPWALELIVDSSSGGPKAALATAAASSFRRPGSDLTISITGAGEQATLRFRKSEGPFSVSEEAAAIELTSLRRESAPSPEVGLEAGMMLGRFMLQMPSNAALAASQVDLGGILAAGETARRDLLAGRTVLIADTRSGRDGPFQHPDGRRLNGCFAQAVGIDALLQDASIRQLRYFPEIALTLINALTGASIAAASRGVSRRFLSLSIAIIVLLAAAVLAYRYASVLFNPFAYLAPMLLAFALYRSANLVARPAIGA